ncbi:FAD-dependent oxidoreductase [Muricoccus vinaceus]|uniref:FAD-dependent oxidoreductase n=1 Tax=Muricoccus vinaceus TaxID=424704 RepID=A0ABV6IYB2_9PROT
MPRENGEGFDAVVVGGGIQGLTFALEAGRQGRRVLLLEAGAFGGGSTAASYGIVHGGFRYWQSMDLPRLIRSRLEQAWFLRHFPGLVRPLRCVMPFYGHERSKPGLFATAAVLDRLGSALARNAAPELPVPRLLRRAEVLETAPWLSGDGVRGGGCWHDVEIADYPGLLAALVAQARAAGAVLIDNMAVRRVLPDPRGGVGGVEAADAASGESRRFEAPVVVNCAGAGLDAVARGAHAAAPRFFQPVPAFNLHLEAAATLGAAFAVGRGKRFFVRPSAEGIFAGTFYGARDVKGWVGALDTAAPGLGLGSARVLRVVEGVVPQGREALEPASRDVILDHGASGGPRGLFSVSGVKLTTARWLSARAIGRIWGGGAARVSRPAGALVDAKA